MWEIAKKPSRFAITACAVLSGVFAMGMPQAHAASVTIKRDNYGVPHIYAGDTRSLFYGYGYAVAEDRLYQMEMTRRTAEGKVAEVLGPAYIDTDVATRSNMDPVAIRAQLDRLSPHDRAIFEGYAQGFNARVREVLSHQNTLLPREFIDQGFTPDYWTGYDVAAIWVGLILNRFFSGNTEVANLHLLDELKTQKGTEQGQRIYNQLRWLDDPTAPTILADRRAGPPPPEKAFGPTVTANYLAPITDVAATNYQSDQVARIGASAASGMPTASNAWVISPGKSSSNHAVLYNGPQQGWFAPSIIYSVGLHGAGYDVVGSTPVALPAIFFGSNHQIAWGSTVGALDTNDVYQERLNPTDPHKYLFEGGYRSMQARQEVIAIKGASSRSITVYSTVHGFVSGWDLVNHTAYSLKRSWEGQEIETLLGWAEVSKASSWDGFLRQAQRVAASITWFYADVQGNIGFAALGRLPRRPASQQIQFPASGDGSMEWQGFLPFAANPKQLNPAQGYLVSWNNKSMPGLYADGADYSFVDRVNELSTQLAAKSKLSDEDIWQIDHKAAMADLNARYFIPYIRNAVANLDANDPVRKAGELVAAWDGQAIDPDGTGHYQGSGVTIFRAWLPIMLRSLLQRDLPADIFTKFASTGYLPPLSPQSAKPGMGSKLLWYALQRGRNGAPFNYDFFHDQDPLLVIRKSLAEAVQGLRAKYGEDMTTWLTPVISMRFASSNSLGVPWAANDEQQVVTPYRNRGSVSYRVLLDKAGVTMCSAAPPGQSGFISPSGVPSRHTSDQLNLFAGFRCKQDWLTSGQVDEHAESVEKLTY